ncbi:MAG: alpha/beta hydrolase [Erysipelotrichaceae bacterium]|nr:alpha/beta hydrolase [Erysipelotrichaceae bacterium]
MSLLSMYIRYNFAKGDRKRDAGLTTPDDVKRFDSISYGTDRKWQILDVYRPKDIEGKLPVIVSVHGGGWVYGTKEVYQYYCMSLAQRGFAVINFNYRLAPEHKYPAQIEDTNSVIRWIFANADTYGLDTDNIFAVGDSAGGHLLSVYATMLNDKAYADHYHIDTPQDFRFNAIALNCGVYRQDIPESRKVAGLLNDLLPKGWNKEDIEYLNSYDKIKPGYPPVYLMSANGDFLKSQVDVLVPELEKNDVPYVAKIYGDENNVLHHVFHVNMKLKDAALCNDEECAFFRKHLLNKS